ncbi:MAG: hypothetical protein A2V88_15975 [Elusimicrobia bacterium RBG_16_66_12]|nr:MAG: hypothetical protein A2V88_15975 [Elusimicrobia bacterium RBG_16_66_12]
MKRFLTVGLAALCAIVLALGSMGDVTAATSLTASLASTWSVRLTEALAAGTQSYDSANSGHTVTLTNGSGLNQANKVFVATAAATTSYDLDSTLTGPLGSVSFTRIVGIRVVAASANSAAISVGGDWILTKYLTPGGDTLANTTIPVSINGSWEFVAPTAAGIAVTATTGDVVTITVAGTDSFTVMVVGS